MACSRAPRRRPSSLVISIEQRYWRRPVRRMNDYLVNTLSLARRQPQLTAAGIIAVVGALTICGFYFFQYVLLLPPCPLCLEQRQAYYFCVPLAALLFIGTNYGASSKVMIIHHLRREE